MEELWKIIVEKVSLPVRSPGRKENGGSRLVIFSVRPGIVRGFPTDVLLSLTRRVNTKHSL